MSTTQIQTSSDYASFFSHENQQPVSGKHWTKIAQSMNEIGWLASKPMTVVREGRKFRIVDGHHRFAAAVSLGIPLVFVVEDHEVLDKIGQLNYTVKKWTAMSFCKMYADQGMANYIELLEYIKIGIPIQRAAAMLGGESASSGNVAKLIPSGDFKIKTRVMADSVASFLGAFPENTVISSLTFIDALSALLFVKEFDSSILKKKITQAPAMLTKCTDRDQALSMIEEIYNFRSHARIPLRHLALEGLRARSFKTNGGAK